MPPARRSTRRRATANDEVIGLEPDIPGLVPRPDPTKLTTEAVERATEAFERTTGALGERLDARFEALEQATRILAESTESERLHLREIAELRVAHLKELHDNKIAALAELGEERMVRLDERKESGEVGLAAALSAAEKAVEKQELKVEDGSTTDRTARRVREGPLQSQGDGGGTGEPL